jgi:sulfate transporter 1, high-affinity
MLLLSIQWNWQTILIGASFLIFLMVAKYIVRHSITCSQISSLQSMTLVVTILFHRGNSGQEE